MAQVTPDAAVLAGAVLVAVGLDRAFGEPPVRVHPVVLMGHYLGVVGRRVSRVAGATARPGAEFWGGAWGWFVGVALVVSVAAGLVAGVQTVHPLAQALLLGVLLKPLFAWRMLRDEVQAVEAALASSLAEGRARLTWLVSRDVTILDAAQVRESASETLAENLNDSVVAPLFWFAVAGLPGAALYRFANTADAMWGYRGERQGRDWTWAGKWAARADDVLSWVPARLTALLLAGLGAVVRWRQVRAQARLTPSPNSGWPMAAMALALDVHLAKPGVYTLHPAGRSPQAADTARALKLAGRVVGALAGLAAGVLVVGLWGQAA
ncbi:MAG: adenosylcobinamide-phosphate synthase CbiB [Burkholderiaceae bacterium]|nr:adenosylcobinamide-phosphate synthase CbiB [Burkholderiaceae bacterium]